MSRAALSFRNGSAQLPILKGWTMVSLAVFVSPRGVRALLALLVFVVAAGPLESAGAAGSPAAGSPANVDAARIVQADHDAGNWMTYGRTYSEQRFSPLSQISADNVKQLGLAWYADLDTNRGQEATPLVIDGVLYVSTAWSMVKAYDAKTGRRLWSYDPAVPRVLGVRGCCDVVNRGVAAWQGKIFVGAFDGRLIALDARTGTPVWSVMTVDPSKPYTITMAPRVIKGRVVIGNSGNEYGVRGYVSAYDADTGKLVWRFYTVDGDGGQDLAGRVVEMGRRRRALGGHVLRSQSQLDLSRYRQRTRVEPGISQCESRRQPLSVLDRRDQCRHRQLCVALPSDARRRMGFRCRPAVDPRGPHHRRGAASSDHAGQQERILLCPRPQDR